MQPLTLVDGKRNVQAAVFGESRIDFLIMCAMRGKHLHKLLLFAAQQEDAFVQEPSLKVIVQEVR